jgi:hypothetical protein
MAMSGEAMVEYGRQAHAKLKWIVFVGDGINQWSMIVNNSFEDERKRFVYNIYGKSAAIRLLLYISTSKLFVDDHFAAKVTTN